MNEVYATFFPGGGTFAGALRIATYSKHFLNVALENMAMNSTFWKDKRILLKGHTGFKLGFAGTVQIELYGDLRLAGIARHFSGALSS